MKTKLPKQPKPAQAIARPLSPAEPASTQAAVVSGAKQLNKLKRFLTTLLQFSSDISPEISECVKGLTLGLVNSTISIEDFHNRLQETTNFPLRPFVIPFLKVNLPLLQQELLFFHPSAVRSRPPSPEPGHKRKACEPPASPAHSARRHRHTIQPPEPAQPHATGFNQLQINQLNHFLEASYSMP